MVTNRQIAVGLATIALCFALVGMYGIRQLRLSDLEQERRIEAANAIPPRAVSKTEAIAIANGYFQRAPDSGCVAEERGDYYFVSPPYILAKDSERAGMYVHKESGRLSKKPE